MLTHIASQIRQRPREQGYTVIPSGRCPSTRSRPDGSSMDGIPAAERPRWTTSYRAEWRGMRPVLMWHDNGCDHSRPAFASMMKTDWEYATENNADTESVVVDKSADSAPDWRREAVLKQARRCWQRTEPRWRRLKSTEYRPNFINWDEIQKVGWGFGPTKPKLHRCPLACSLADGGCHVKIFRSYMMPSSTTILRNEVQKLAQDSRSWPYSEKLFGPPLLKGNIKMQMILKFWLYFNAQHQPMAS